MAGPLRLSFQTPEGHPCARAPVSAAELARALGMEGIMEGLWQAGLPRGPRRRGESQRVELHVLARLADRLDPGLAGAAALQDLLKETTTSKGRPIVLVLDLPERPMSLQLLAPPAQLSSAEYERDLRDGPEERVAEVLATLVTWSREHVERPERLGGLLVPHLRAPETRAAAARVVGTLGLTDQAPLLERLLRQGNTLATRLALVGALMDLEHDELALRTIRSMLVYGTKENHTPIIDVVVRHAQARHLSDLRAMLRLLEPVERVALSAALYGLGELSVYARIARALNALNSGTSDTITARVLSAMELVDSSRFCPLLSRYADRETRRWFGARALAISASLQRNGRRESTCEELLNEVEHALWTDETERGIRLVDQLLVLEPQNARALYLKASVLKDEDRFEDALKCATSAVAANPSDWQAHRLRGSLQWDLGRSEAALEAYDRALELNPTDPFTWYYKGYVLYRLRRPEHALPCLDRSLSLDPDVPSVQNHKAFCLEQLERYEEAVGCYKRSLRLRPADVATRDHLASALHKSGELTEALQVVEITLKLVPQRLRSLEQRAETLRVMKRWRQAEDAFADVLREAPDRFNAWVSRGTINHRLGDLDRAVECLKHAVRLSPESVPARNLLARFLKQLRGNN